MMDLVLTFNIDPTGVLATIVVGFTLWLFWPYYRAMWLYRRSGKMDEETPDALIAFTMEWLAKAPKKPGRRWFRR